MKITIKQLRQVIKEEVQSNSINEGTNGEIKSEFVPRFFIEKNRQGLCINVDGNYLSERIWADKPEEIINWLTQLQNNVNKALNEAKKLTSGQRPVLPGQTKLLP